jgi:4-diphosphocytidyl-2-C-methyl-D-erythritol kinase
MEPPEDAVNAPASDTRWMEARAKVNLFLRVLGIRPDGYHDLETLIVPISLADRLQIHARADESFRTLSLSLDVSGDPELVRGVPRDESNLVMRAAVALAERLGVRGFADIELEKMVRSAAGLGGGSADAAAVLLLLNELWHCGMNAEELRDVGASVGSDVPALMMGQPTLAAGRGERVQLARCRPLGLAVVTFSFAVSTPEAYRWWDEAGTTGPDPSPLLEAARDGDVADLAPLLFNDLQDPVIRHHAEVGRAGSILLDGGAVGAVMSGSGPTVVGLMRAPADRLAPAAEQAIEELSGEPPKYVRTTGST